MSYLQTIRNTQKSGRKANREVGKPASQKPKNPANKSRPVGKPYAWWKVGDWEWRLLKSYQSDNGKQYARWFMAVKSPATYDSFELGDGYCSESRSYLRDAIAAAGFSSDGSSGVGITWWYDETVWSTPGEFAAWIWGEK